MELGTFLLANLLNGIMAVILMLTGYKIFDKITPDWNFQEIFKEKGVSGGAIIVAAFLLGLALVIMGAAF